MVRVEELPDAMETGLATIVTIGVGDFRCRKLQPLRSSGSRIPGKRAITVRQGPSKRAFIKVFSF
jgi:hypothetical protein